MKWLRLQVFTLIVASERSSELIRQGWEQWAHCTRLAVGVAMWHMQPTVALACWWPAGGLLLGALHQHQDWHPEPQGESDGGAGWEDGRLWRTWCGSHT